MKMPILCGVVLWLATLSMASWADTRGETEGSMKNGAGLVIFGCDNDNDCFIAVYPSRHSAQRKEFAHEPCTMSESRIACAAMAKSPLVGANYVGESVGASCGKPMILYRLVSAPKRSLAPKRLIENMDCEP